MSDSLIEQVKRLAEAASAADAANRTKEQHRNACVKYASACAQVNFPALLAHLQAQQAVCDAARANNEARKVMRVTRDRYVTTDSYSDSLAAYEAERVFISTSTSLDAALENLRSDNDGK